MHDMSPTAISDRFRLAVEVRIAKLEQDAHNDARVIPLLHNEDHRRRHGRLVAAQLEEATQLRLRLKAAGHDQKNLPARRIYSR